MITDANNYDDRPRPVLSQPLDGEVNRPPIWIPIYPYATLSQSHIYDEAVSDLIKNRWLFVD